MLRHMIEESLWENLDASHTIPEAMTWLMNDRAWFTYQYTQNPSNKFAQS